MAQANAVMITILQNSFQNSRTAYTSNRYPTL